MSSHTKYSSDSENLDMESTGFGSDFKKRKALPDESTGTASFEPKRKRLPQTVPPPPTPQYKHANPNIDIEALLHSCERTASSQDDLYIAPSVCSSPASSPQIQSSSSSALNTPISTPFSLPSAASRVGIVPYCNSRSPRAGESTAGFGSIAALASPLPSTSRSQSLQQRSPPFVPPTNIHAVSHVRQQQTLVNPLPSRRSPAVTLSMLNSSRCLSASPLLNRLSPLVVAHDVGSTGNSPEAAASPTSAFLPTVPRAMRSASSSPALVVSSGGTPIPSFFATPAPPNRHFNAPARLATTTMAPFFSTSDSHTAAVATVKTNPISTSNSSPPSAAPTRNVVVADNSRAGKHKHPPLHKQTESELCGSICALLRERNRPLIEMIVSSIGCSRSIALLQQARTIERSGGMMRDDASGLKRRPGGVFLYLVRSSVSSELWSSMVEAERARRRSERSEQRRKTTQMVDEVTDELEQMLCSADDGERAEDGQLTDDLPELPAVESPPRPSPSAPNEFDECDDAELVSVVTQHSSRDSAASCFKAPMPRVHCIVHNEMQGTSSPVLSQDTNTMSMSSPARRPDALDFEMDDK